MAAGLLLFLRNWAPRPLLRPPLGTAAACLTRKCPRRGDVARSAASASGGSDGSGDLSEDESQREWEAELSRRLKEAEEMEELERTAEQLQSQPAEEESEEEKRERVRSELEKVVSLSTHPYFCLPSPRHSNWRSHFLRGIGIAGGQGAGGEKRDGEADV
jgi:hypothetical protein